MRPPRTDYSKAADGTSWETPKEIAGYYDLQGLLWRTGCAEVIPCFDERSPGSFS